MALNKDGLEPGQLVDYNTMLKVEKERKAEKKEPDKPATKRQVVKQTNKA